MNITHHTTIAAALAGMDVLSALALEHVYRNQTEYGSEDLRAATHLMMLARRLELTNTARKVPPSVTALMEEMPAGDALIAHDLATWASRKDLLALIRRMRKRVYQLQINEDV